MWRTTSAVGFHALPPVISIHVLRVEDDESARSVGRSRSHFNPRPPCGGRPVGEGCLTHLIYFNPRPPCGGRPKLAGWIGSGRGFQSTSSVWRTTRHPACIHCFDIISIHVLRVEDDVVISALPPGWNLFQSTSSVWRTTASNNSNFYHQPHFNPRPPCGGRLIWVTRPLQTLQISIHVLRVEDDRPGPDESSTEGNFNPRPPCGGRRRI